MKKIMIVVSLLLSTILNAQVNLVPNGSFEQYDTCQSSTGTIFRAVGWENVTASVEYLNSCLNTSTPILGVPQNGFGYQMAEDGNAYVAPYLYVYGDSIGSETIGRQLSHPLVIGQKYYCSFYVSLVDSGGCTAINKIGMKFSTIDHGCQWCINAPLNPSLINDSVAIYTNTIITDKINWTKISGWYTADSAYDYVMLGRFFYYAHTDTLLGSQAVSVYYLDNVYVGLDSVSNYHDGIPSLNSIANQISIYPNPATSSLTISSNNDAIENLEIYSMVGKLIYTESVGRRNEVSISVASITQGIYFIKVLTTKINSIQKISIIH
ncbi:MAG: T9SS type A sorting domain-containing protein [Bacteroidota bacterium]